MKYIHSTAKESLALLAVNPNTGQLKIKVQPSSSLLESLGCRQAYFSTTLMESVKLMNTFAPMYLHNISRLPSHALQKYLSSSFKEFYYGQKGIFRAYAEIKEILTLNRYDPSETPTR